ncbi:putative membrane protein [Rhizobium sullae]|uniref:Putative membrane protein n=2 Tax=Rhizobium sullae TaxID=50338 RepID=A0A4V2V7T4_RHISU|nr:putative membrane protein [Rhizobium sullae]
MRSILIFAAMTIAMTLALASAGMAKSDKEFLSDAMKGDNSEITLGELATQKGGSEDVRSLGRALVDDHRKAKDEATALASDLEVKITTTITAEAQSAVEKLQRTSGPEFDQAFVDYMISNLEKDIAEFKEKAGEGGRPVPEFAKKMLPVLQKHLQLAQALSRH